MDILYTKRLKMAKGLQSLRLALNGGLATEKLAIWYKFGYYLRIKIQLPPYKVDLMRIQFAKVAHLLMGKVAT